MTKSPVKNESKSKQITFHLENNTVALEVFGADEQNLKILEDQLDIRIKSRGNDLVLEGVTRNVERAESCLNYLKTLAESGQGVSDKDVRDSLRVSAQDNNVDLKAILNQNCIVSAKKKVFARTLGQKNYVDAIYKNDIVFGIGPAGTGKTYLAVAVGVAKLLNGDVDRIVLTRPAVEAGEKLGFLPGDLSEKVDPYLRPLLDALQEMVDYERVERMLAAGQIEIAPIAFMRGRTLNDSYIILDEAQNCTREQMKMFLTRLGENSHTVITGDATQIDLPRDKKSGLIQAVKILKDIKGISIHHFSAADVVRHQLVAKIIEAYDRANKLP